MSALILLVSAEEVGTKASDGRMACGPLKSWHCQVEGAKPLNVVVGAMICASPLISASFNEDTTIEALDRTGLEFTSVGNQEFDKGLAELLRMQTGGCRVVNGAQDTNSCEGAAAGTPVPFEGAKFKYLSANVISTTTGKPCSRRIAPRPSMA